MYEGGAGHFGDRFLTAEGKIRWLRDEMRLAGQEGHASIVIGYMSDITAEREAKIRLRHTERLAALGEVASRIAHELNQPLATIALAAEIGGHALAGDLPVPEKAVAKFGRIHKEAERLKRLIALIGMFGRKETEQPIGFMLDEVLQNCLMLVAPRLQLTGTMVSLDLPSDLPELRAPPILLEQVVLNLIANACDAYADAPQSPVRAAERRIHITARRDNGAILISVADRAGGIPSGVIDRVFDPFFTTKPPGKGTGLGLSICFAIIAGIGGQISVRNEFGGAVFEIRLPLTTGSDDAVSAQPDLLQTGVL